MRSATLNPGESSSVQFGPEDMYCAFRAAQDDGVVSLSPESDGMMLLPLNKEVVLQNVLYPHMRFGVGLVEPQHTAAVNHSILLAVILPPPSQFRSHAVALVMYGVTESDMVWHVIPPEKFTDGVKSDVLR